MWSQYIRLGVHVTAPGSAVVRAARRLVSIEGRKRYLRDTRHAWLRALLEYHRDAQRLAGLC